MANVVGCEGACDDVCDACQLRETAIVSSPKANTDLICPVGSSGPPIRSGSRIFVEVCVPVVLGMYRIFLGKNVFVFECRQKSIFLVHSELELACEILMEHRR